MNKAAIIGGGVIGGGWAARFLLNGWDVAVFDPDPEAARKVGEVLDNARRSLPALYDRPLPQPGALTFHDTVAAAVEGAAWIQESVPERLDLKHRVFAEIQAAANPEAIIGSSTSGFKPSELQQDAARPGQILVCHPFNPVYLLPLVEVVASPEVSEATRVRCAEVLAAIGMKPLMVRREIDAHIADRFLEAVWREALWLVRDGVATTTEIDDAIRYGFGLRWAQMGLFETYRIAGGEAGMRHFIEQFGPCLAWPWTRLTDVPELTDELIDTIAAQSDEQSGRYGIRELERIRDDNLVGILRVLKRHRWGAGELLAEHDGQPPPEAAAPVETARRQVPQTWADYNGHMNESRYLEAFSNATDRLMEVIGADADYIAAGGSYFTVETHLRYLDEVRAGEPLTVTTMVLGGAGKTLHLYHQMLAGEEQRPAATAEVMLLHVDLATRRSSPPAPAVAERLARLLREHAALPRPEGIGRAIVGD